MRVTCHHTSLAILASKGRPNSSKPDADSVETECAHRPNLHTTSDHRKSFELPTSHCHMLHSFYSDVLLWRMVADDAGRWLPSKLFSLNLNVLQLQAHKNQNRTVTLWVCGKFAHNPQYVSTTSWQGLYVNFIVRKLKEKWWLTWP